MSTLPLKKNKNIKGPPGIKTIRKIRFGSFILKDVFVVINASVGHQTKIYNIRYYRTTQI